jgi:hypothetical protein
MMNDKGVLRTIYIDPEIADALTSEAISRRVHVHELVNDYLRIGLKVGRPLKIIENKIEALKQARHILLTTKEEFICYALGTVMDRARRAGNQDIRGAAGNLIVYVQKSLKDHTTLGEWQDNNGWFFDRDVDEDRIAWIEWMIADLEAQKK